MSLNKQDWQKNTLAPILKKTAERQEKFVTSSGAELDTVFTAEDLGAPKYDQHIGFPGEYPYTRGIHPNMYRGRLWTTRQYAGFGTAEDTNKRFQWLLGQGQTGLSIAFDLPTQIGYDSDNPATRGEVGRVGVAVDTLLDMETILDSIPLDKISTSMTINATNNVLLAMYIAVAKKQGVTIPNLQGTTQNDILKEYIARGTYIYPVEPSIRLIVDSAAYCSEYLPNWNFINIAGYHIREAGATAGQEIGFTLADAIEYVQAFIQSGLDVDDFGPRISWIFAVHNNFLEEVAKFRALRTLWARIMKQRFGAKNPRSWMMRAHVQTGGVTLTAQQPMVNIPRATIQALAAVLGGIQSLAVSCYDEGIGIPTEEAQLESLRIQQIIAHESAVADTVDPLGGSFCIEYLTEQLEKEASFYIEKIDALGGAAAAINTGYQQSEIQKAAYEYQKKIENKQQVIVGINEYLSPSPKIPRTLISPDLRKKQIKRLNKVKKKRDNKAVDRSLERLNEVARGSDNTMPVLIECVEAYATIGEISDTMRQVFGIQAERISG
ncbi:methylmalonyl-CoA mutase [Chloroflexota bacterium]